MQVKMETVENLCRMKLAGELNGEKAHGVKSLVLQNLRDDLTLEIDFSGVRIFDMAGLHVISDIRRHAEFIGAPVRFVANNFAAREILELHERIWALVAPTQQLWARAA